MEAATAVSQGQRHHTGRVRAGESGLTAVRPRVGQVMSWGCLLDRSIAVGTAILHSYPQPVDGSAPTAWLQRVGRRILAENRSRRLTTPQTV
jgi:hypothetical protein